MLKEGIMKLICILILTYTINLKSVNTRAINHQRDNSSFSLSFFNYEQEEEVSKEVIQQLNTRMINTTSVEILRYRTFLDSVYFFDMKNNLVDGCKDNSISLSNLSHLTLGETNITLPTILSPRGFLVCMRDTPIISTSSHQNFSDGVRSTILESRLSRTRLYFFSFNISSTGYQMDDKEGGEEMKETMMVIVAQPISSPKPLNSNWILIAIIFLMLSLIVGLSGFYPMILKQIDPIDSRQSGRKDEEKMVVDFINPFHYDDFSARNHDLNFKSIGTTSDGNKTRRNHVDSNTNHDAILNLKLKKKT